MAAVPPPPPPPPPIAAEFTAPPAPPPPPNPAPDVPAESVNTQQNSQAAPTSNNGEKLWERAWNLEELRKGTSKWTLAADAGLLLYLQQFSQKIVSQTHEIEKKVDGLVGSTKGIQSKVQNTVNDFLMLSNTQFIENRVYEEDISKEEEQGSGPQNNDNTKEKPKVQREEDVIPRIKEALRHGIGVMDDAFITLELNTEHDSDEDDNANVQTKYKPAPILEPKDPYSHRPLPHLIGTVDFYKDELVGLGESESEDEGAEEEEEKESESESETASSAFGSEESESESSSESETESTKEKKMIIKKQRKQVSSSEEESDEGDLFGEKKKPKDENEDEEENSETEEQPRKPVGGPINFAAELASKIGVAPPPAADSDEEAAEPGAWSDEEKKPQQPEKQRSETNRSRTESKGKKEKHHHHKKGRSRTKSGEKKHDKSKKVNDEEDLFSQPTGGDDGLVDTDGSPFAKKGGLFSSGGGLFDDDDDKEGGLFGDEKSEKSSIKNEQDEEEEEEEEEIKVVKPRARSTASGKRIPAGAVSIFGDGFLPASPAKQDSMPSTPEDKPARKQTSQGGGGLFDEDEDEGLFGSGASQKKPSNDVTQSAQKKPPVDLFGGDNEEEEDDLFAGKAKQEQAPPQKKLPAGAVPMFGGVSPLSKKATRSPSVEEVKPSPEQQTTKPKSGGGLFSDDDKEGGVGGGGLFAAPKPKQEPKSRAKTTISLFDDDEQDDDDDFFSPPPTTKPASTKKETKPEVAKQEQKSKPAASGLFDDDGEDLFDSPAPTRKAFDTTPKETGKPKPQMPSLFSDEEDDGMFGGEAEDLFQAGTPKKPETKTAPKKAPTSESTAAAKPNKPSLFSDEEEDLFGGGSKSEAKPAAQDPETEKPEAEVKKPWKPAGGVSLFGGVDMFAGKKPSFTESEDDSPKASEKPKQAAPAKVPEQKKTVFASDDDDDEDDFFGKPQPPPLSESPAPTLSAPASMPVPTPAVPPAKTKAAPSLFSDDDEDLFAGKEDPPPLASPPEQPKSKKPAGAVSMFGGVDLFGSIPKSSAQKPLKSAAKAVEKPAAATKIKDPLGGLFGEDEEDSLFAAKPKPQAAASPKPVAKPIPASPPSTGKPSPPPLGESPASNTSPPLISAAKSESSIGKLQKSLAFNPAMLQPGGAPPRKVADTAAATFDKPAEEKTLENVGKDRARIQVRRRPPTRNARRSAAVASATDESLFGSPLAPGSPPPLTALDDSYTVTIQVESNPDLPDLSRKGTRDSDMSDEFFGFASSKTTKEKSVSSNEPDEMFAASSKAKSPDLFGGDVLANETTTEKNQTQKTDRVEDLFGSSSNGSVAKRDMPVSKKNDKTSLFDDDLFGRDSQKSMTNPLKDNDLFGSTTAPTINSKKKTNTEVSTDSDFFSGKKQNTSNDIEQGTRSQLKDEDLFSSSKSDNGNKKATTKDNDLLENIEKKPSVAPIESAKSLDEDDLFGAASGTKKTVSQAKTQKKKAKPAGDDDDDDLFTVKKVERKPRKVNKPLGDDDLFGDSGDIFADVPSKPKEKKKKKPAAASASEDSIFDEKPTSDKTTKKTKAKKKPEKKPAKTTSIFDEDAPNIFDDPLNATSK
ncbi:WASH complex subunit 2 [Nematostella vectensis]|uniref:WASH complex subunit 2 n=1 Tax=Nematostella vectensis TaxID=45351 RepID=UPI00207717E3|nr:WASH complex subunit 2 [Nematostella vectensis]